jgi:phosphate transport system ATP-binding protein
VTDILPRAGAEQAFTDAGIAARLTPARALRAESTRTEPDARMGHTGVSVRTDALHAMYGTVAVVRDATIAFAPGRVTAIIGPSGCGKSTLLRCINRLHETQPTARISGAVFVAERNVYAPGTDAALVRRGIGFVAQRPTPFPSMSIRDNVAAGLRVAGMRVIGRECEDQVEAVLKRTGLWDEVADRLDGDPMQLSGGQQQRLCLARALAPAPKLLLLDEPTAALDPGSTQRIEELVYRLRGDVTTIIVTHNMQQAARVSDVTAFMLDGTLIEQAPTRVLFTAPGDPRTELYLTGRFG